MKLRKVRVNGRIVWFSRAGDVARMGPFATQVEAAAHVMTHDPQCVIHHWPGVDCNCALRPIEGAFVWPEKRR